MYQATDVGDPRVSQELRKLEEAFSGPHDFLFVRETFAAISKPRKGMIIYADGVVYDPGSGEGLYVFDGSTWNNLSIGAVNSLQYIPQTAAPSLPTDGLTVFADGTTWNPGSGKGLYVRKSGAWAFLG